MDATATAATAAAVASTAPVSAESLPSTHHDTHTELADNQHQQPPNPPPETAADAGEKRKRDDAEGEVKSSTLHPLHKTSLCSFYRRLDKGECSHGATCRFAHDESELRQRPDGSWDPTSKRAKMLDSNEKAEVEEERAEEEEESEWNQAQNSLMITEALGEGDQKLSKCLVHLPRNWHSDQLNKFLAEQRVVFKSAKKKKGMTVGFVSFETAEQLESATEVLHGKTMGNKKLKVADALARSYDHKIISARNEQLASKTGSGHGVDLLPSSDDVDNGDMLVGTGAIGKCAREVVTPLAHMSYPEQLEYKKDALMKTLKGLTRNTRKACRNGIPVPEWIYQAKDIGGMPCKFEGIIESPIINGYRNKCEFSVGYSVEGKITAGFLPGNFREGVTAVDEPIDCPNVTKLACKYASIFQEFLQDSTLPVWNRFKNTGFWRQLTVREGRCPEKTTMVDGEVNTSEVLLIVQVCSTGVDDGLLNNEFKNMTRAFIAGAASASPPLPLTALVVQDHTGISNVAAADAPLRVLPLSADQSDSTSEVADTNAANEGRIHDSISNLKFSISPTAFFQVNTLAAEKMYSLAGDWAGLGPDTLLFDICCGTGTIGLTLAHRVGMVVGIEMNASAVSDAQRNAEINGIKNCRFVCSKAESVLKSLLSEYLHVPLKPDETSDIPEGDDKEDAEANHENAPADKDIAEGDDEKLKSETCSSKSAEDAVEKPQTQLGNTPQLTEDGSHEKKQFDKLVVIVDPPRMGLHPKVTKTLRTHPLLRRLVYISCNPETLVANAIELCTPSSTEAKKENRGAQGWRRMSSAGLARQRAKSMPNSEPFRPVKAMAVDMFPHTPHCEVVMLLER